MALQSDNIESGFYSFADRSGRGILKQGGEGMRKTLCVALLLVWASARAFGAQCDSPPYGDTQQNYAAILDAYTRASKTEPQIPPMLLTRMMQVTMNSACKAKFFGGERSTFYKAGLSDHDIDTLGPAALTDAWFGSHNKANYNESSGESSDCSRPPYGDTITRFKAFTAKYQSTDAVSLISILERTCRAKFDAVGDRKPLYTVGLTDQEISAGSTTTLATVWMDTTLKALGFASPSFKGGGVTRSSKKVEDYVSLSVRDFVIDGPKLAAVHAQVSIVGAYVLRGGVGILYPDSQAVMMATPNSGAGIQPSVVLLTNGASHQLRSTLVSCDSDPGTAQMGCQIVIRGRANSCTVNNMFGATREVQCVNVEDGEVSRYSRAGP